MTRYHTDSIARFWKFYPNVLPDFESSYFYTAKIGKQSRKIRQTRRMFNFREKIIVFTWIPFDL